jgi:ABC-2 type transport system permease protein
MIGRPRLASRVRPRSRLRQRRSGLVAAAAALPVLVLLSGCGSTGLTAAPLQASISRTFANLYVLQQAEQGNPRPSPGSLRARASCQRGTPATRQDGSGNWLCLITYEVAGPGYPVVAKYKVDVQTDGCYAADGDGPASVNGSPTITGPHYAQLVNPLSLIDGCFNFT